MEALVFSVGFALTIFGLISGLVENATGGGGINFFAAMMLSGAILAAGGAIGWAIHYGRGR